MHFTSSSTSPGAGNDAYLDAATVPVSDVVAQEYCKICKSQTHTASTKGQCEAITSTAIEVNIFQYIGCIVVAIDMLVGRSNY